MIVSTPAQSVFTTFPSPPEIPSCFHNPRQPVTVVFLSFPGIHINETLHAYNTWRLTLVTRHDVI